VEHCESLLREDSVVQRRRSSFLSRQASMHIFVTEPMPKIVVDLIMTKVGGRPFNKRGGRRVLHTVGCQMLCGLE
jgi:hypothetical protein